MNEVSTIGLDLARPLFQAHGAEASGAMVFRKALRQVQVLASFTSRPRRLVAMEAGVEPEDRRRAPGAVTPESDGLGA